ncbi:NYN domain limkain-b1-type [Arabidopsis suecica]|uniref:NYN domain limkain-b1-type n=1 Tax=Arabidopsis suecica TaxID=45249 RepID=A0A8T2H346_ARASU|nr:NYN domain limkain-b1-type [Arabidopsis suecica]
MMNKDDAKYEAVTGVIWDIKRCPVPTGFDARRVGPCIRRLLENLGYTGPLTITAVGILTDVSDDFLRAITSTGITLDHVPYDYKSIVTVIYNWTDSNPPPANLMVISTAFDRTVGELSLEGYNILRPFGYDPLAFPSTNAEILWSNFLLADTEALGEDKCSGKSESVPWVCSVCEDVDGQGFDEFKSHLSSRKHELEVSKWFPEKQQHSAPSETHAEEDQEEAVEAGVESPLDSHPKNSTTMLSKQPKRKRKKRST